jgi:hypothetical protein
MLAMPLIADEYMLHATSPRGHMCLHAGDATRYMPHATCATCHMPHACFHAGYALHATYMPHRHATC